MWICRRPFPSRDFCLQRHPTSSSINKKVLNCRNQNSRTRSSYSGQCKKTYLSRAYSGLICFVTCLWHLTSAHVVEHGYNPRKEAWDTQQLHCYAGWLFLREGREDLSSKLGTIELWWDCFASGPEKTRPSSYNLLANRRCDVSVHKLSYI